MGAWVPLPPKGQGQQDTHQGPRPLTVAGGEQLGGPWRWTQNQTRKNRAHVGHQLPPLEEEEEEEEEEEWGALAPSLRVRQGSPGVAGPHLPQRSTPRRLHPHHGDICRWGLKT